MKYINGTFVIEREDMNRVIERNNLDKAISIGYKTLAMMEDEKGKVCFDYKNMSERYKKMIKDFFGDPYSYHAKQPILKMLPDVPEDARTFYYSYEYDKGKTLPVEHIQQCLRYVQWLKLVESFVSDPKVKREIKQTLNLQIDKISEHIREMMVLEQKTGRIGGKHATTWQRINTNILILAGKKTSESGRSGYEAFVPTSFGNTARLKMTEDTIRLLNNLFVKQAFKPTPTQVAEQYLKFKAGTMDLVMDGTGEVMNPADFPELAEETVKFWLAKWENNAPAKMARTGNRQLSIAELIPSHAKIQPLYPGSKLSIDDRQPPFEYAKSSRVWFYEGIDLASDAWTVWVYGKTKEGLIVEFYRQMVRNYSEWNLCLPYELECEMSLNSTYKDTLLADGAMFGKVQMEANNARGKRIERHFHTKRYGKEKMREGWKARPFARSEPNRSGPKNTEYSKDIFIPYDTIVENEIADMVEWNNSEHPKHPGKSRWDVFMTMQHPNLKPINWRGILPFIGLTTDTSVNAGILILQGSKWLLGTNNKVSTGSELVNYLKLVNDKEVKCYWLDGNDGKVLKAHVCTKDGRYICEAIPKPEYNSATLEQNDTDREARVLMSKYVATVTGYINGEKKQYEGITTIDNTPKFQPQTLFVVPGKKGVAVTTVTERETENLGNVYDKPEYSIPTTRSHTPSWRDNFLNG